MPLAAAGDAGLGVNDRAAAVSVGYQRGLLR